MKNLNHLFWLQASNLAPKMVHRRPALQLPRFLSPGRIIDVLLSTKCRVPRQIQPGIRKLTF